MTGRGKPKTIIGIPLALHESVGGDVRGTRLGWWITMVAERRISKFFSRSRLVEEKMYIRGGIDDHSHFLRQAKQGSVEIEREIQLRIEFRTNSAYEP